MNMLSKMLSIRWSWRTLFSYGEVLCFISAWAVGLLMAIEGPRVSNQSVAKRSFTADSTGLGIQAALRR
jgi:hypothetical protein